MTIENAQRNAIADLDRALAESLKREQEQRLIAESLQMVAHRLERQLAEAHQLTDAVQRRADEADSRSESSNRAWRALRALQESTARDRDHWARRAAVAESDLDQLRAERAWWRRWLSWT